MPSWRRQWHPTLVLLPGKSHGRRSLVGCSPWGRKESYMTARLHFHFSLSCIGEGNGNPLQCSCLENPRDGGPPGGLPSMGSHRVEHVICLQCRRPGFDSWVGKIPWEKEMAIHSSILSWRIPWAEEPGGHSSPVSRLVKNPPANAGEARDRRLVPHVEDEPCIVIPKPDHPELASLWPSAGK